MSVSRFSRDEQQVAGSGLKIAADAVGKNVETLEYVAA
jgi:hypothetical protein